MATTTKMSVNALMPVNAAGAPVFADLAAYEAAYGSIRNIRLNEDGTGIAAANALKPVTAAYTFAKTDLIVQVREHSVTIAPEGKSAEWVCTGIGESMAYLSVLSSAYFLNSYPNSVEGLHMKYSKETLNGLSVKMFAGFATNACPIEALRPVTGVNILKWQKTTGLSVQSTISTYVKWTVGESEQTRTNRDTFLFHIAYDMLLAGTSVQINPMLKDKTVNADGSYALTYNPTRVAALLSKYTSKWSLTEAEQLVAKAEAIEAKQTKSEGEAINILVAKGYIAAPTEQTMGTITVSGQVYEVKTLFGRKISQYKGTGNLFLGTIDLNAGNVVRFLTTLRDQKRTLVFADGR